MSAPLILDLFCGAGGAAKGYQRAGFEVVGVDHRPQSHYCGDSFVQADAVRVLAYVRNGFTGYDVFDAIHAAPMWMRFAPLQLAARATHDDEITPVFEALEQTGLPYVLESGTLGPFPRGDLSMICGASVGLEVVRHMWFKTNWPLMVPPCAHRPGGTTDGTYVAIRSSGKVRVGRKTPPRRRTRDWMAAADLEWMTQEQARLASPPAYTELIGHQLLDYLRASRCSLPGAQTEDLGSAQERRAPDGGAEA